MEFHGNAAEGQSPHGRGLFATQDAAAGGVVAAERAILPAPAEPAPASGIVRLAAHVRARHPSLLGGARMPASRAMLNAAVRADPALRHDFQARGWDAGLADDVARLLPYHFLFHQSPSLDYPLMASKFGVTVIPGTLTPVIECLCPVLATANHSCDPNCRLTQECRRGRAFFVLVALRPISRGEELTYQYAATPGDVLKHHHFQCQCALCSPQPAVN
eukprot:jgi/Tetstr1/454225/TSEL_041144.t1